MPDAELTRFAKQIGLRTVRAIRHDLKHCENFKFYWQEQ